ncbi:MAG: acyl-CoA thioesterase [Chromatiaceae bacterium]|nr:MAG: acyl-CoA thioesterase [Chromatiaceae bacterium]
MATRATAVTGSPPHRFRVALHDSDAAGVLFFAHLFRHAHDAYEDLMEALGWRLDALIRAGQLALPLVHAEADYRLPLRHGETVEVAVEVLAVGTRSFTLGYRFSTAAGAFAATARTIHAGLDPHRGCPVKLPADLAAALRARNPALAETGSGPKPRSAGDPGANAEPAV